MTKNQDDFFDELQPWSKIKNDLLATYLRPYFTKISNTRRDTLYIDCFAGKGRFKDGNDGSPFLAVRTRAMALNAKNMNHGNIQLAFIEKEHAAELRSNLAEAFPDMPGPMVVDGCFETDLLPLLKKHLRKNLFLYVDPFGVKLLQYSLLKDLANSRYFPSIEILMNFNTFGLLRAAKSILAKREKISDAWDSSGFLEKTAAVRERKSQRSSLKTPEDVSGVVHGDYWLDIIRKHVGIPKGFKEAEKELANAYRRELAKLFKYVLKMPIGKKDGSIPEYCMYFMTNHHDGCLLMVDNMMKRSEDLRIDVQQRGQMSIFAQDVENNLVDSAGIQSDFQAFLERHVADAPYPQRENVDVLKARFFAEYGVVCKSATLNKLLEKMEMAGIIQVERQPKDGTHPTVGRSRAPKSFNSRHLDIRVSWSKSGG